MRLTPPGQLLRADVSPAPKSYALSSKLCSISGHHTDTDWPVCRDGRADWCQWGECPHLAQLQQCYIQTKYNLTHHSSEVLWYHGRNPLLLGIYFSFGSSFYLPKDWAHVRPDVPKDINEYIASWRWRGICRQGWVYMEEHGKNHRLEEEDHNWLQFSHL